MEDKGVLIFGASGLIGRYLFNYLKSKEKYVIGTYNSRERSDLIKFNISIDPIKKISNLEKIKYGVLCSGITKIDECKKNSEHSHKINIGGTERILEELLRNRITPVFLSGAAVFNGEGNENEDSVRNPVNLYGKQKVRIENFLFNQKDYLVIRPGKVVGIKVGEGGLFADWLYKYNNGDPLKCLDDENLSVTYVEDLVKSIVLLLEKDSRGIYHINPPEHYTRFELATKFFNYLGIKEFKLERCSTRDLCFLEKRAKNSYLDASKFIEETGFKFTSLEDYFNLIKEDNL